MSNIYRNNSLGVILFFASLMSVPLMGQVELPALLVLEKGADQIAFRSGDYMVLRDASGKILSRGRLQIFQNEIVTLSGRNGGAVHSRHISRIDGNYPILTLVARRTFQAVSVYTAGAVLFGVFSDMASDGYYLIGVVFVGVGFVLPGAIIYGLLESLINTQIHLIGGGQWQLLDGASHMEND